MNGLQHYKKAELLLFEAHELEEQNKATYLVAGALSKAQVHATLALAAWSVEGTGPS